MALAFVHIREFNLDDELFRLFWKTPNQERHSEFISFMGRHTILREGGEEDTKPDFEKLKGFWDWALANPSEKQSLAAFGYWMRADKRLVENGWLATRIRKTLAKTDGVLDFSYKMMEALGQLASDAPDDVLEILRLHLLVGRVEDPRKSGWTLVDDDLVKLFRTLYQIATTQAGNSPPSRRPSGWVAPNTGS